MLQQLHNQEIILIPPESYDNVMIMMVNSFSCFCVGLVRARLCDPPGVLHSLSSGNRDAPKLPVQFVLTSAVLRLNNERCDTEDGY